MKVAIYAQSLQDEDIIYVFRLLTDLKKVDAEVFIEENLQKKEVGFSSYATYTNTQGLDTSFNLFISFGGDGTILRAATYVKDLGVPIVGINTGRLGFLSTYKKENIENLVVEYSAGAYTVEERSLVQIELDPPISEFSDLNFALNEVTVSRKDTTSMITVETFLDEEYLTSYWADGLIISTPTGSTGYSLSCGGPVIDPKAKSLVLTPIAPHHLNARPLVISDDTEIRIRVSGREEHHLISLDSRIAAIPNGTEITVKKAKFTIRMMEYKTESFFKTLRGKLLWGQDKRN